MKPPPPFPASGLSQRAALEASVLLGEEAATARLTPEATRAWTILVVDDDADTRRYVGRCLQAGRLPRPVRVVDAAGGDDALRCLRGEPFDLVITDLHMPGLDGAGLVAALDADASLAAVPLLFLSGDAEAARMLVGDRRHLLPKPFNCRRLTGAVLALLGAPDPS